MRKLLTITLQTLRKYKHKIFLLSMLILRLDIVDIVSNVLSKIDQKKATGLDMIPSNLLKMAANIVAPSLTSIFSKSILTGIYPNDWKMAKVTPLFKKGIKSDPNNYRPISVIPIISKEIGRASCRERV